MIITQTPLRISLAGGGTDFPEYFGRRGGAVVSMAIDKYVFVIVKERFDEEIRLNYSVKEIAQSVEEIKHDLIREAAKVTGLGPGVEVTTLADVPSEGSGLGSSSSVTVGLLNAFYAYQGIPVEAERLAREACDIEIRRLGRPIGVQDQYIAAFGGMRYFEFLTSGAVKVDKLNVRAAEKRRLVSNLKLYFTNRTRSASDILAAQKRDIGLRLEELDRIRAAAHDAKTLVESSQFDELGPLLDRTWKEKRKLAGAISNPEIDQMYSRGLGAGATGGKLIGAGGGGFMLFYCPQDRQDALRKELTAYRELPFMLEPDGSKVIFNLRRYEWK